MSQLNLFDSEPINATCPTCRNTSFAPIGGGSGRLRCLKCGWLIVINEKGQQRDALDWTRAGRKRGK